MSFKDGL